MADDRDTSDWTPIVVQGPLPMDVAATVMTLIGTAYPSAVIDGSGKHTHGFGRFDRAFVFLIDPKERAKRVTKKAAAALKTHTEDPAQEPTAHGFSADDDGMTLHASTSQELMHDLGNMAHAIYGAEGGDNYIEWEVVTGPEVEPAASYVLSVARSKGQTPHALRTRAEKDLADLRGQLRAIADAVTRTDTNRHDVAEQLLALAGE